MARVLPLLLPVILALLAYLLSFNGLYGQDAHEYLRLSQVYRDLLNSFPAPATGVGNPEFAAGFPLAGGVLQLLGCEPVRALQIVSWVSAGGAFWAFEACLRCLSPGSRAESRWVFAGVGLALSPYFVRAGLTAMSDCLGLAFALAAFACSFRAIESHRFEAAPWGAFFAGLAVLTRFSAAALLIPLMGALCAYLIKHKKHRLVIPTILFGGLGFLPHFLLKTGEAQNMLGHSLFKDWSAAHFFQSAFTNLNGTVEYAVPNWLYLFFPLMHPGFCLLLPGLLLLVKKTDIHLTTRKLLLLCLVLYLMLLGGIAHQNLRYLLPAYTVLLLLFFPAWDRMYAYGFYFFKRLTFSVIGLVLLVQVVCNFRIIAPVIERQRLETGIANRLRQTLPPGAELFSFDIDVALRSYLPEIRIHSLWEQAYDNFPPESFVLFNEPALSRQWAGQNPMINWEFLQSRYKMRPVMALPAGWTLYQTGESK
jgi:hypothetical protein